MLEFARGSYLRQVTAVSMLRVVWLTHKRLKAHSSEALCSAWIPRVPTPRSRSGEVSFTRASVPHSPRDRSADSQSARISIGDDTNTTRMWGIPSVTCRPGGMIHPQTYGRGEHVATEELMPATKMYTAAMVELISFQVPAALPPAAAESPLTNRPLQWNLFFGGIHEQVFDASANVSPSIRRCGHIYHKAI